MKIHFRAIIEGFRNHIAPPAKLKQLIQEVSEERLSICTDCPEFKETKLKIKYCNQCGCTFPAKAKSLSSSCPLNKWLAYVTPDEEAAIDNIIEDGKDQLPE